MTQTSRPPTQLTLQAGNDRTTVDLYSTQGRELIADLWLKLAAEYKMMYEPTWLGTRIIQLSDDIVQMQELIWSLRPDVIVETGVAHGGSLILSASICELAGRGRVIGVDIEIRAANRAALESHSLFHRIELIEGSSVDDATFAKVAELCSGAARVLVVLDSNHSASHVSREIEMYSRLVTPGSYLVVMDGAQGQVWDIPRGKAEWRDDNPLVAIRRFLQETDDFVVDTHYVRLGVTSNPSGFLRRRER